MNSKLHPQSRYVNDFATLRPCITAMLALFSFALIAVAQPTKIEKELRWIDAKELCIEGKGWKDTQRFYDRLPAKAQGVVREPVWDLSKDSAGISIRLVTDATKIWARWTLRKEKLAAPHMPASGASGVDLYVRHNGGWHWLGAGRPTTGITTSQQLTTGMSPQPRECVIYLPLYNGVEKIEIGVPLEAKCFLPPTRPEKMKPIVFYGTSIVQGAAASRPGMAYPAILGRRLDNTILNLGFSGNAVCEPEVGALLAQLDPAVYVIDPLPNMNDEGVAKRIPELIAKIRETHPKTPIVLIENTEMGDALVNPSRRGGYSRSNAELKKLFDHRVKAGDKKIFYIPGGKLLGDDGQGTVDRVHPTDLGFMRMADVIEPVLKRALRASK
ncbi:MAG: hypothetical protein DVB33_00735 [Verrucomicrobia bacterium]|jgi:lysophospholipase L1-like esterase|nr:MAG: hypothetical protein DVB33_00735 [Verrucomicrobiota bacterium]